MSLLPSRSSEIKVQYAKQKACLASSLNINRNAYPGPIFKIPTSSLIGFCGLPYLVKLPKQKFLC